ncbi:MAG: tetratricopeptide repeat protein [Planctomycetes bacterium]|nr:tetratricopeptide repeat protein [Planctomycetota bacterium]
MLTPLRLPTVYQQPIQLLPAEFSAPPAAYSLVYPAVGFLPFDDLGNGDEYGCYWPLGKEEHDPLVAMSSRYCGTLGPIGSCLKSFYLTACARYGDDADENEDDEGESFASVSCLHRFLQSARQQVASPEEIPRLDSADYERLLELDPRSPHLQTARADQLLSDGDAEQAEGLYRQAIATLPEYTAAHYGLAMACRRQRKVDLAAWHFLAAIRNPVSFDGRSFWFEALLNAPMRYNWRKKSLDMLKRLPTRQQDAVADDPLFAVLGRLSFAYGVKNNDDYGLYEQVINSYLEAGRPLDAILLWMLYGELMGFETVSFRERYGFSEQTFGERLFSLFQAAGLKRRALLLHDMILRLDCAKWRR